MAGFKISNDVGATVFAILSGLSALFFTAWIFGTGGCRDTNSPKITPIPETSASQKGELADAKAALDEEAARRTQLAADLRSSQSDLKSLEEENTALRLQLEKNGNDNRLSDLRLKLKAANEQKASLQAKLEAANNAKANLDARLAELQKKLSGVEKKNADIALKLKNMGEGDSKAAALAAELSTLKQSASNKEKSLLAQIAELKKSMSGDSKKLAAELEALKKSSADNEQIAAAKAKKLTDEVNALTKKLTDDAKACEAAKRTLMVEINTLNGELDALKHGDKLKRAVDFPELDLPMLVNDPLKLDAKVRPLFIKLRGIKETAADREAVYKLIAEQNISNAKDMVQFASASSEVSEAERKELAEKLKDLGKNAKVLAVGYASVDGDAKSNYELSSKRASSVAQEVAKVTGLGEEQIQAVYFGQTKRFDEKNLTPNRVVEVWVSQ